MHFHHIPFLPANSLYSHLSLSCHSYSWLLEHTDPFEVKLLSWLEVGSTHYNCILQTQQENCRKNYSSHWKGLLTWSRNIPQNCTFLCRDFWGGAHLHQTAAPRDESPFLQLQEKRIMGVITLNIKQMSFTTLKQLHYLWTHTHVEGFPFRFVYSAEHFSVTPV